MRVFSEGTKSNETLEQAKYRRYHGGEVDSPSRNLARFMQSLAGPGISPASACAWSTAPTATDAAATRPNSSAQGFPAVRVTESHEDYTHQHQDIRNENGVQYGDTIEHVDFDYLANVTRLNAITMAALARAPAPPQGVDIQGEVAYDTTVSWQPAAGAARYRVWWRETTAPQWQQCARCRQRHFAEARGHQHRRLLLRGVRGERGRLGESGGVSGVRRNVRQIAAGSGHRVNYLQLMRGD